MFDLFDPASKVDSLLYACDDAVRATIYTLDDFKEVTLSFRLAEPPGFSVMKKCRNEIG